MLKKRFLTFVIAVVMMFSLAGCDLSGKHKIHEEGYFQYIIVGESTRFPQNRKDRRIAIVGLTESGKEQEVIDIPGNIAGKEVTTIGYSPISAPFIGGLGSGYYQFESPNLKKLFIHDNIKSIGRNVFALISDLSIMVCGAKRIIDINWDVSALYVYSDLFEDFKNTNDFIFILSILRPANVTFLNNYSNEINKGYYRLDNIESGEKIPQPPAPERDGYIFTGWYTESECLNLWDFDTALEIAENTEFRLYAGWQAK